MLLRLGDKGRVATVSSLRGVHHAEEVMLLLQTQLTETMFDMHIYLDIIIIRLLRGST